MSRHLHGIYDRWQTATWMGPGGQISSGIPSWSRWVQFTLAALLFAAALFKGHDWLTAGTTYSSPIRFPGLVPILVGAELALALWLLSNWRPREAWLTSLVVFGGFAAYSLLPCFKIGRRVAASGNSTCRRGSC